MASMWPRIIVHADMDAFYAAVEQRDDPSLRGRPVVVGHPGPRSVVSTASYEARRFGVGSAMPMAEARRRCPEAIVVIPRFEQYEEVSRRIMEVFRSFSPDVEPLSLDEAFIDMTGAERLFGEPEAMARRIKQGVREATDLAVSVGVSATKYVAKVASDLGKPDGLLVVPPDSVLAFLDPLPIARLWGVGRKAAPRLERLGLRTIRDVREADRVWLERTFGHLGTHIHALAKGEDPRPVVSSRTRQSVGHEDTLARDIRGPDAAKPWLLGAADRVAERLRAGKFLASGVRVKLKTASFRLMTRQRRLDVPTDSADPLYKAALGILPEFDWSEPLRLVGLTAFDLVGASDPLQGQLFGQDARRKQADLDKTVDALRARFGRDVIRRGTDGRGHDRDGHDRDASDRKESDRKESDRDESDRHESDPS
ncbi:MAG: DNA polymerase IV [Deltaproteobacteria bacterium]|nr:DNA polymerase IV [Deltaproteobacteria bacterium]